MHQPGSTDNSDSEGPPTTEPYGPPVPRPASACGVRISLSSHLPPASFDIAQERLDFGHSQHAAASTFRVCHQAGFRRASMTRSGGQSRSSRWLGLSIGRCFTSSWPPDLHIYTDGSYQSGKNCSGFGAQ